MGKLSCVFILTCLYGNVLMVPVRATDASSDVGNDVDVKYTAANLVLLGEKINSPLLKLLGLTLCHVNPCSSWSQWSECRAEKGQKFGTRNRTRECNNPSAGCYSSRTEIDNEVALCDYCPPGFTKAVRLCFKIIEEKVPFSDGVKRCLKEGSHLLHVDSEIKLLDLKNSAILTEFIWVDGTRNSTSSPWMFQYGGVPDDFTWGSNQPNGQHCMAFHKEFTRYDVPCTNGYFTACEY